MMRKPIVSSLAFLASQLLWSCAVSDANPGSDSTAEADSGGATSAECARHAIEHTAVTALAERFSDACNVGDGAAFASLWHPDRADWRIGAPMSREFHGADSLEDALEEMLGMWDFFVQTPNATVVEFSDDYRRATSRTHVHRARPPHRRPR